MFFLSFLEQVFNNFFFIFITTGLSFLLKVYLLVVLLRQVSRSSIINKHFFFLLSIIIGNMFSDFAWIMKLTKILFMPLLDYRLVLFFVRLAWVFFIVQYQALALFIENLVTQQYIFSLRQRLFCSISILLSASFLVLIGLNFNCYDANERVYWEATLQNISILFVLFPLILSSVYIVLREIGRECLPLILKKQLSLLVQGLIIPLIIADFIQMCPFKIRSLEILAHNYAAVGFTTILLTLAIYFCARKIFGLRFLNLKDHVQQSININFIDDFKGVLERLGSVTNFRELGHITENFFKESFGITANKTRLYLRQPGTSEQKITANMIEDRTVSVVENFLISHAVIIEQTIKNEKILIYDEIDFTHFYHACETSEIILRFLSGINADIFLPIYEKDKLIAYIVIDRHARAEKFYSNIERDELIVFGSYLGNIINLLQNKSLELLREQEQRLRDEIYQKHQQIEQYKESVRSFVRQGRAKHIGILFYKNRQFAYGNQAAKDLIDININQQHGHPITQSLRQLAHQVESFKGPKTIFLKNSTDTSLIVCAVPHLEKNTVIITISYPSISDTIKHKMDSLRDPSEWDYLLYLETTQSGKLINQLIPGSGTMLLNFKIELLKIALSKKAILLDMPEHDLQPTAEIINRISLRDQLQVITVQNAAHSMDVSLALFGMNPLFDGLQKNKQQLLERLDNIGTVFIKNIHFLDLETQDCLAVFIKTGFYSQLKSDTKIASNVRIIGSTNQNLALLVQEGKFSKSLFQELKSTLVAMPSLLTLPEDELHALTDGFTQQVLMTDALQHVLSLTDREKNIFTKDRPISLQELKTRVHGVLVKKSKKNHLSQEVSFDPAYEVTDPDLIEAVRLGKKALQEPRIMTLLWNKFKNQNKIASFLGVNRSSVNRRCKEYKLL
jgi:transcriptional regulator with PAS, ATPase and Fis domain